VPQIVVTNHAAEAVEDLAIDQVLPGYRDGTSPVTCVSRRLLVKLAGVVIFRSAGR